MTPGVVCEREPNVLVCMPRHRKGSGASASRRSSIWGVHADTMARILEHHSKAVAKYAKTVKHPYTGDRWGCD